MGHRNLGSPGRGPSAGTITRHYGARVSLSTPAERGNPTDPDAARRRDEAIALAAEILRIDSTNGNETAVAEVLAAYLGAAGVETELVARDPRRANLVARIPGIGGGPSLAFVGTATWSRPTRATGRTRRSRACSTTTATCGAAARWT
jgi:hypothetical protein